MLSANATAARRDGEDYVLELDDGRELRGDRLLVATGRRPRVRGVGLETVGVEPDAHGVPVDAHLRAAERLWAIGDVTGLWPLTHVGKYQGDVVAANILGEPRKANYEAVPRVAYTDPQAAAVGADAGRFSAMVPLSEVAKTATYTRAYAESNGFLTLLSDGERLTGAYALGPEAGEWLQQATLADPRPRPARRPGRHDPAVPDVLGDLRRGAEGAARRRSRRRASRSARDRPWRSDRRGASRRRPSSRELRGQTVVVIGGSAGIGLETARRARAEGADVILAGRDPGRLERAAATLGAAEHRDVRRQRLGGPRGLLRRPRGTDRPRDGHGGRPVLRAAGRDGLRRGTPRAPAASDADGRRRPLRRPQGPPRRHARVHGRHGRAQSVEGRRPRLGDDRRPPGPDREPGARGRAGPRQPHRRRLRRHAPVGVAPRRGAPGAARRARARRSRSGASSGRRTSPRWRCTSWPTPR